MIKKSLTVRVLIISVLLLALPLLIASFIFFQDTYRNEIEDAKQSLKEVTDFKSLAILASQPVREVFLRELIYLLDLSKRVEQQDQEKLSQELIQIVHAEEGSHIFVLNISEDGDYKIVASSSQSLLNTYFVSHEQLQHVIHEGQGSFIRYNYSSILQRYIPYLFVARVILSEQSGKPIGIIMVATDIENQLNALLERHRGFLDVQFALLNSDEIILAATDKALAGQYFTPISSQRRDEIIASGQMGITQLAQKPLKSTQKQNSAYFEFIYNREVQIAYRANMEALNISIVGYLEKKAFFASALHRFSLIYTLYGLVVIVGSLVTYGLTLWISRSLRQLSYLMRQVSLGNLDIHFKEQPFGFEINILGKIFNYTIKTLLENMQNAENERVKKQTYERELAIGRQVQQSLLPHETPPIKGAQMASFYAAASDIKGNLYTFITKQSNKGEDLLILPVIDVEGGGMTSSLYALSINSLFRAYTTLSDDIGDILAYVNNDFIHDVGNTGMAFGVFAGMYHTESRIWTYYCGHQMFGFVKHLGGEIISFTHSDVPFGLQKSENSYPTQSVGLNSGDMVLLYTKGLVTAFGQQDQHDAEKRLHYLLQSETWENAQMLVDCIVQDIRASTHALLQQEEIILVALMVE